MNSTIEQDQWADKNLTEAQRENRALAEVIPVGAHGTTPQNFAQLVDYAKFMSTARGVVGEHLIHNVGACLAVLEIANKFAMPGYMVASQTYAVDGKVAFMGQLIMAIINKHCPLDGRLRYVFDGAKGPKNISTRRVTVIGRMKGETEDLTYESPIVKDIRIKNSPLWEEDQDQQLIYFASRRWQRRHWPEGLMGVYSPDELEERHYGAENARNITPGGALMERLAAARLGGEGFKDGHTAAQVLAMRNGDMEPGDEVPPKQLDEKGTETASTEGAKIDIAASGPEEGAGAPVVAGATKAAPAGKNAQAALPLAAETAPETFVALTISALEGAASSNAVKEAFASFKKAGRDDLTADQELAVTRAKTAALRRFSKKEG